MSDETMHTNGENTIPPETDSAVASPPPLEGQLVKRIERRRLDLMTLHGVAREGARLYRSLRAGRIGLKKYVAASGGLRRQAETLRDIAARELIQRQLRSADGQPIAEVPSLSDIWRTIKFVTPAPVNAEPPAVQPPESVQ
jgi:hypothetical protein